MPQQLALVPLQQRPVPLKGPPLMYLLPWKQGEQATAAPGQNEPRTKMTLKDVGQQNVCGHSQGDGKTGPPIPSCSRMRREGVTPPRSYTGMRGSSRQFHHNVATMGITYLHPEVLLRDVWSLRNQVLCMISEYHLAGHAQGSSSLSPVLLEAATELLPPLDKYTGGVGFHGMRDVRVVDLAKTLRIAAWLHRLDMAVAEKDQIASQTQEAARHQKGPLIDLFLAPMTGNLTFAEVVGRVLDENRHQEETLLADLQGHRTQIRGELDDLIETR